MAIDYHDVGTAGETQGLFIAWNGDGPYEPGLTILDNADGKPWYLWFATDGKLRIHDDVPGSDTDGVVVGSQF